MTFCNVKGVVPINTSELFRAFWSLNCFGTTVCTLCSHRFIFQSQQNHLTQIHQVDTNSNVMIIVFMCCFARRQQFAETCHISLFCCPKVAKKLQL